MLKVLLVDDHPIVLSGLSALVQSDDALALIATARTVAQALAVTAQPDVAVVDLEVLDVRELVERLERADVDLLLVWSDRVLTATKLDEVFELNSASSGRSTTR